MKIFLFILPFFIIMIVATLYFFKLSLILYFMTINLDKHPYLKKTIGDALNKIAKKEDIGVFDLSYDELNKNEKNGENEACGAYIFTEDNEYLKKIKKIYNDMVEIEKKYETPYHILYEKQFNKPSNTRTHDFCIPRIEIAKDKNPSRWTKLYYFKTFAHELGHHFAIKNENDRSEERADEISAKLIYNHTPTYFRLIYGNLFNIVFDNKINKKKFGMPSGFKFWKLVWTYYLDYHRKRKKLNVTIL